ncbi:MAG: hypothetical protein HC918_02410 [Oscillatoriales cyanobacterium SM2_1_8]|nr:hypothetical protein [Oscillatoriales cyanobacterium SM2_1_8]
MDGQPNNLTKPPESSLQGQIHRQRARFIAERYGLYGAPETTAARAHLEQLLTQYQGVEIALVEILVETWQQMPPPRGLAFLDQVEARLHLWHTTALEPTLPPDHFQHITGLHPQPILTTSAIPPTIA